MRLFTINYANAALSAASYSLRDSILSGASSDLTKDKSEAVLGLTKDESRSCLYAKAFIYRALRNVWSSIVGVVGLFLFPVGIRLPTLLSISTDLRR